jgi:hypothetical protein
VSASHPEYATAISPKLQVDDGEEYSGVDLVLGNGGSIEGNITDNGIPLAGQMISMWAWDSSAAPGMIRSISPLTFVQTDNRGYYRKDELMPGHYYLSANIPTRRADVSGGKKVVTDIVEIIEGRTTTYDIDLCEGGFVTGQVIVFTGEEVIDEGPLPPGMSGIRLDLVSRNSSPVAPNDGHVVQTTPASLGSSYSFDNICPGEYTIAPHFLYETTGGTTSRGIPYKLYPSGILKVEEGTTSEKDIILFF